MNRKMIGYILITFGFLLGSYIAVEQVDGVRWSAFSAAMVAGIMGVVVVRRALKAEAGQEEKLASDMATLEQSLEHVVTDVAALQAEKDDIDVYDLRHEIDKRFPEYLDAFVQARESIANSYGLQAYADVMNPFAAAERYLNRVWSTSTDGYIDEAHTYIDKALEQFTEALEELRRVRDA
ncbi:MAG: hypothetical protein AAGD38_22580 [Acidobacteriota bacterium]